MNDWFEFNSLLVPIDFSPPSEMAFERAVQIVSGDDPVLILLHVIDPSLVEFAATHDMGEKTQIVQIMRERAEEQLAMYKERVASERIEIDTIVCEGIPFFEILRKAADFEVDATIIGKVGAGEALEKLLFGSTAEKVLRGSQRPILVLPYDE